MAEVGVHLDDEAGAAVERDAEPVEVGATEALLRRPDAARGPGGRPRRGRRRAGRCRRVNPSSTTSRVASGSASRMAAEIGPTLSASW